jgi:uncharacterized protein (TIGR01777 family)
MKVAVCGGSGFIGQMLAGYLVSRKLEVVILDRNSSRIISPRLQSFVVDLLRPELFEEKMFHNVDAVINLSGKDIFTLWTETNRRAIRGSRITVNRNLVDAIAKLSRKPKVFISASAVGYYGEKGEAMLDENAEKGQGFLADVCVDWEREARRVEALGVRSVQVRTAPVLGKRGGIMGQLMKSFRFGFTFRFGSGRNWFPWIHMDDLVRIYHSVVTDESLEGPVNACAPHPLRFRDFLDELRRYKNVMVIPFPPGILRLLISETADVLTFSQRMVPSKLQEHGFEFSYPDIRHALQEVFAK